MLWPTDPLRGTEPGNDASVTMLIEGVGECPRRCLSGVFLGDLGESSQARMAAVSRLQPVDVVKVAHHGSGDQSPRLYDRLSAAVALIGVGSDNTYGHPVEATLQMLRDDTTEVARTDGDGLVLISPASGGGIAVWRERGG